MRMKVIEKIVKNIIKSHALHRIKKAIEREKQKNPWNFQRIDVWMH